MMALVIDYELIDPLDIISIFYLKPIYRFCKVFAPFCPVKQIVELFYNISYKSGILSSKEN